MKGGVEKKDMKNYVASGDDDLLRNFWRLEKVEKFVDFGLVESFTGDNMLDVRGDSEWGCFALSAVNIFSQCLPKRWKCFIYINHIELLENLCIKKYMNINSY